MNRTSVVAGLSACLVVGVFLVFSFRGASESAWLRIGQTHYPGGFGQAIGSDGVDLFVLRQFSQTTIASFQRFVVDDGVVVRVTNLTPPPHDIKNGTTLAFDPDRTLYALFGADYNDRRRHFARYSAGRWVDLPDTPIDQGAGDAMTFVSHQGKRFLYAVLGAAQAQRPDAQTGFFRFDLSTRRWDRLLNPPWACSDDGSSLAWDGGDFVYALQGSDCQDQPTRQFARYYLALNLWEPLSEVPDSVDYGASLVWNGGQHLFAITGTDTESEGRGFFAYDLASQGWDSSMPELNCSVGDYNGNRLAAIEGRIFYWQGTPPTWTDTEKCNGRGIYVFSWR